MKKIATITTEDGKRITRELENGLSIDDLYNAESRGKDVLIHVSKQKTMSNQDRPDYLKGKHSMQELRQKYDVSDSVFKEAIAKGIAHELEHTSQPEVAKQIAIDHLYESLNYYDKLERLHFAKGGIMKTMQATARLPKRFYDDSGQRKIDRETIAELTKYVNGLTQTKDMHYDSNRHDYYPDRKALHAEIINSYKQKVVCVTKERPLAILMGGSPASGKSSFLRKYSPYLLQDEILKVDADDIRSQLPEYQGWNASQTHLETKDIVNTLISNRSIGIPCVFDMIYDGTMNSVGSYEPLINLLKTLNYRVFIVYMDNVPKDVVVDRALQRYQKVGRFVPLEVIDDFYSKGRTAFDALKDKVDGYMVIDAGNPEMNIIEEGGMKLPKERNYSKLGQPIDPNTLPDVYKRGGTIPDPTEAQQFDIDIDF